jgi:hypothetical protein
MKKLFTEMKRLIDINPASGGGIIVQKMTDFKTNVQYLTVGRSKNGRLRAKVVQILGCISR